MQFSHISLKNWRNFTKVDADLPDRVFLVGPNASGKSNLLDVLRFLRDIASVGGGLQAAVSKRGGISRLRCLAARKISDIVVDVKILNKNTLWEYLLQLNQDKQKRPVVKREAVWKDGHLVMERPDQEDESDPERKTQTSLEQVTVNKSFREVADFFASIRYLHLVPQLIREPERSAGHQKDPYGGDFLEQVAKQRKKTRDAWLRRIYNSLKVAVPQLNTLIFSQDERGVPHLQGRYEHWRPQGAWQNEVQFSDGTLRLIGLLWSLLDGKGPLLLEEPELSLHPEVIRYIPPMVARFQQRTSRQIFISTHSTDLLKDEGIGVHEVLLLIPSDKGTEVRLAKIDAEISILLEKGISMAEAVFPKTQPANAHQLSLFGD